LIDRVMKMEGLLVSYEQNRVQSAQDIFGEGGLRLDL